MDEVKENNLRKIILKAQRSEITDHFVYKRLAFWVKNKKHAEILQRISQEELTHYQIFKDITKEDILPDRFKVFFYIFISKLLGLNFGLRLMEKAEQLTQDIYEKIKSDSSKIEEIISEEKIHENNLISLIDEEYLRYVSSVVLGLNDALVELSGALVGFTLALQKTKLVALVGLITGVAASLSMAGSEYLSTKHESIDKSPLKASLYTGLAYILTVVLLVFPYFLFKNIYLALGLVVFSVFFLILFFTFYISVAKQLDFKKRFLEMAGISLTVAMLNFGIGLVIRKAFGIDL